MPAVTRPAALRALVKSGKMVVAPGAYDCITARLVDQAGFPAVYMTGAGTSASYGYPDFGLVTMSEMVANARRLVDTIPCARFAHAAVGAATRVHPERIEYRHRRRMARHQRVHRILDRKDLVRHM